MINYKQIGRVISVLLFVMGGSMLTGVPFSVYYQSGDALYLVYSAAICLAVGCLLWVLSNNKSKSVNKREGYLIVAMGWLSMVTFGMLPYLSAVKSPL